MRRSEPEFQALGAQILYISAATPECAARYAHDLGLTAPVLLDPNRRVYRPYGVRESLRGSALSPAIWTAYVRLLATGRRFPGGGRPTESPLQMGADFIVGPDGRMVYAYCSAHSADRPDVSTLLAIVRSFAGGRR